MKKINITLAIIALFTFSNVLANDINKVDEPKTELSRQIHTLLEENPFEIQNDLEANVRLTFNQAGEIVILSIDADNAELASFVKGRLNYTKVDFSAGVEGKVYTLPVKVLAS